MIKTRKCFLQMLLLELDDLETDIELLIEHYKQDHDMEKISNYVFYENVAMLQNELFGVKGLFDQMKALDPESFESVETIATFAVTWLEGRCRKTGLVKGVIGLVNRKITKVQDYLKKTAGCLEVDSVFPCCRM